MSRFTNVNKEMDIWPSRDPKDLFSCLLSSTLLRVTNSFYE